MFISDCLNVNKEGHLTIGGISTVSLAEKYGTPLYVMDENLIRDNIRSFKKSIERYYAGHGLVAYASKAFACKAMYAICKDEGIGVDVVSGGELYTALQAGFDPENIVFHGNNKTPDELAMAVKAGVGRIVVDNISELHLLDGIARAAGKNVRIMFRIKPGVDAHTHNFIRTGQIDSKFGFALETGEAMAAVEEALKLPELTLVGLHCHIGSQIFDIEPFEHAAEVMLQFMGEIKNKYGAVLKELNLGGGFGIKYLPEHDPDDYDTYMKRVSTVVKKTTAQLGMPEPFILIEPGRSIVGPAGITLYKVGAIKEIPGIRTYVSIDGGMGDNPRYILYQSDYDVMVANKAAEQKTEVVTVAGKCCESGDLIQENASIQHVEVGDVLAVLATGAYNYSMASNYNRIPRAAVVFVKDGRDRLAIRRETYDDLVLCDCE